ncbi:MAG: hypothetical protein J1F03_02675 [Oscillospiraceae bacterium]|nr:hypothetical protein [Oscillospiraceae bacterium]
MPNKNMEDEKQPKKFNAKPIIVTCVLLILVALIVSVLIITNPYKDHTSGKVSDYGFVGTGTEADPFLISSVEDFCLFRDLVNSGTTFSGEYLKQTADLDLSEINNWIPIGKYETNNFFCGSYNGDGHTISDLTVTRSDDCGYNGLFGMLCGEVCNLGIESGYIEGIFVGSIASHGDVSAKIINCYNKATVHGFGRAGGIVDNFGGMVYYCWNLGDVICDNNVYAGGISSLNGKIRKCYSYNMPVVIDEFIGEITEAQRFDSFGEIDWLDEVYSAQYYAELNRKSEVSPSERIRFIVKDGNDILFDRNFTPNCVVEATIHRLFSDYGAIILLAAAAAVMIIIAVRKPKAAGAVLTFMLVCGGMKFLNDIMLPKDGISPMENYYDQPKNSVDVLMIGSSRLGFNQDCEVLWKDYGISGYALWGSDQPAWNSYYMLNEALECSTPKVVVFDICAVYKEQEELVESSKYHNIFGMRFSLNKFETIQASTPQDLWLNMLFEFPISHARYSELNARDFIWYSDANLENISKGSFIFGYGRDEKLWTSGSAEGVDTVKKIPQKQLEFVMKIIERCDRENIPLVFIASNIEDRSLHQPYFNYISVLASDHGVPFINYNLLDAETGFDDSDLWVEGHLNTKGARKQSAYLGKYLKENYDLFDHRGDPYYSSWDELLAWRQNTYIPMINGRRDYIYELLRDDKTVVIIKQSVDESDPAYEAFKRDAADLGFDMSFLDSSENGCWVIEHPGISYENTDLGDRNASFRLGDEELAVNLSGRVISYAGKPITGIPDGVVCIVYDRNTKQIVDKCLIFDPSKSNIIEGSDTFQTVSHI